MFKDIGNWIAKKIKSLKLSHIAIVVVCVIGLVLVFDKSRNWLIDNFYFTVVDSFRPKSDQAYYFNRGVRYQEIQRNMLSIRTFERVMKAEGGRINPVSPYQKQALFNMGVIYYQMGQASVKDKKKQDLYFSQAKALWLNYLKWFPVIRGIPDDPKMREQIIEATTYIDSHEDPSPGKFYKDLGQKAYYSKDYKKAIEYYKKAITVDPKYDIAYNNIGSVYFYQKDYRNAIKYWEQAVLLNPKDNKDLYLNIGGIYKEVLTNYPRSVYFLKKHLEMNPNDEQRPDIEFAIQEMENKINANKK